jgi:hypothetical protein
MMKKTILVVSFVSLTPLLFSFISKNKSRQKVLRTIIVDAGHGIMPMEVTMARRKLFV